MSVGAAATTGRVCGLSQNNKWLCLAYFLRHAWLDWASGSPIGFGDDNCVVGNDGCADVGDDGRAGVRVVLGLGY